MFQTIDNKPIFLKILVFLFPIFLIIFTAPESVLLEQYGYAYNQFFNEDEIVENLTSVFYFLSGIISIIISRIFFKTNKKAFGLVYLILGIIFFIGGFEEISWGQRILGFETPSSFSDNLQNELTLHNFPQMPNTVFWFYIIIGSYASLAWIFLHEKKNSSHRLFVRYFVPKWHFCVFFFPFFLIGVKTFLQNFNFNDSVFFIIRYLLLNHNHEYFELLQSAGIFIFTISVFLKLRDNK